MFVFENGALWVISSAELVNKLRNLAAFEQGSANPQLTLVDVQTHNGVHKGVGLVSKGQALVLYFEEEAAKPEQKVEDVKTETAEQPTS